MSASPPSLRSLCLVAVLWRFLNVLPESSKEVLRVCWKLIAVNESHGSRVFSLNIFLLFGHSDSVLGFCRKLNFLSNNSPEK